MLYSMKQTCDQTGLTYDTLKFYCNEGLIPNVKRDKNNYRVFNDKDIAWIKSLSCLKNCGMSIIEMKEYLKLCLKLWNEYYRNERIFKTLFGGRKFYSREAKDIRY